MIIALEGIDACGKETQAKLLVEEAKARGMRARILDFPHYETETGQLVRSMLQGDWYCCEKTGGSKQETNAMVRQCLLLVNRSEQMPLIETFADDPNALLVLDRYWLSGLAYGMCEGLDRSWYLSTVTRDVMPDFWFLLDVSVEESIRRRPTRGDYYEKNSALLRKVRGRYVELFIDLPEHFHMTDFHIVSGEQSQAEVFQTLVGCIWPVHEDLICDG